MNTTTQPIVGLAFDEMLKGFNESYAGQCVRRFDCLGLVCELIRERKIGTNGCITFVVKWLAVPPSAIIVEAFFELVDKCKDELLNHPKWQPTCIRFLVEVLPIRHDSIFDVGGVPTSPVFEQAKPMWTTNISDSVLCYGVIDVRIRFNIYFAGNVEDNQSPNKTQTETILVSSVATLAELRQVIVNSQKIDEKYTIGQFYLDNNHNGFADSLLVSEISILRTRRLCYDFMCMTVEENNWLL
jgi:hypothetical protein